MTYLELYEKANKMLDNNDITIGEYEKMIKPLVAEVARWIPCNERVPEEEQRVLCQTVTKKGTANIVIGYHANERWCCGMNSNVVAWMSLPEPYGREADETD